MTIQPATLTQTCSQKPETHSLKPNNPKSTHEAEVLISNNPTLCSSVQARMKAPEVQPGNADIDGKLGSDSEQTPQL